MIKLLPNANETLIVVHDWDEVLRRLGSITASERLRTPQPEKILAGWIKDDRFQLLIRQRRPNSFIPLVEGRIDPTSTGCLIFLHYRLMPATRLYLILWTIIAFISGIFLAIYYNNVLLTAAALGLILLVYLIAWANFRLHQKPLHDVIFEVLG